MAAPDLASPARADVASALAKGYGIVLLSTGAPAPCEGLPARLRVLKPKGNRNPGYMPINHFAYESDFLDHHGFVLAFALPPGPYDFTHQVISSWLAVVERPIASFTVQAGKIVYLGQLFMTRSCDPSGIEYAVRDAKPRDLAVAFEQNPWLLDLEVVVRPMRMKLAN
jgi:hypothetical protein